MGLLRDRHGCPSGATRCAAWRPFLKRLSAGSWHAHCIEACRTRRAGGTSMEKQMLRWNIPFTMLALTLVACGGSDRHADTPANANDSTGGMGSPPSDPQPSPSPTDDSAAPPDAPPSGTTAPGSPPTSSFVPAPHESDAALLASRAYISSEYPASAGNGSGTGGHSMTSAGGTAGHSSMTSAGGSGGR